MASCFDFSAHTLQRGQLRVTLWEEGLQGCERDERQEGRGEGEEGRRRKRRRRGAGEEGSGQDPLNAADLTRERRMSHPFTRQVDLLREIPTPSASSTSGTSQKKWWYYRCTGPMAALLEPPFLEEIVLGRAASPTTTGSSSSSSGNTARTGRHSKGSFACQAEHTTGEEGNSFAIVDGTLLLSLDRQSFQLLGLPGVAMSSTFSKETTKSSRKKSSSSRARRPPHTPGGSTVSRYEASIDMRADAFRPGKKLYEQTLRCLGRGRVKDVCMLATWTSEAGVCEEVQFPREFIVERVDLIPTLKVLSRVCLPELNWRHYCSPGGRGEEGAPATADSQPSRTVKVKLLEDLFEWLGAAACGITSLLQRQGRASADAEQAEEEEGEEGGGGRRKRGGGRKSIIVASEEVEGDAASFLSSFHVPRHLHFHPKRTLQRERWSGLVPASLVESLINEQQGTTKGGRGGSGGGDGGRNSAADASTKWSAVSVWPHANSPFVKRATTPCGTAVATPPMASSSGSSSWSSSTACSPSQDMYVVVCASPALRFCAFLSAFCPGMVAS